MSETDIVYIAEILPKLKEPMPYKWRVQSFSKDKPKATCVAYIDARDVMDRLDEVCIYGWHRNHEEIKDHIYAGIGIILPSGKIMWRWDCGTESNTEAEKGESSDSFKRAAVNFGIGRFLYELKIQYVDANEKKTKDNYPHVVDSNNKRVWDLTKHINGGSQSKNVREEKKEPTFKDKMKAYAENNQKKYLDALKFFNEYSSWRDVKANEQNKILEIMDRTFNDEPGPSSMAMRNDD